MNLEELRKNINGIDNEILNLIKKRAEYVTKVGELKNKENSLIYIPEREKQIFERLKSMNDTKIPNDSLITIFTEIISACRSLEKNLSISYLGPDTSFTHTAAIKKFGSSVIFRAQSSIESVFYDVERNFSDYGVVPIENSTEGTVNYTLDKFFDSDLKIVSEMELKISHTLSTTESDIKNIKKVYSHPQSFGQCKNWILNNLKSAELIEVPSNSLAAEIASKESGTAAICPKLAALKYKLNIIFDSIEDSENNTTRFLVIGRNINNPSGKDKTSIMFSLKEKIGALYSILNIFYVYNINLTMIESRPNKKTPWQYVFFLDLEGHHKEEHVSAALDKIQSMCTDFKILGSYPRS